MNLRPSGYEPDELPDCSTPQQRARIVRAAGGEFKKSIRFEAHDWQCGLRMAGSMLRKASASERDSDLYLRDGPNTELDQNRRSDSQGEHRKTIGAE